MDSRYDSLDERVVAEITYPKGFRSRRLASIYEFLRIMAGSVGRSNEDSQVKLV